jgi:hypothetical protein
MAKSVTQDGLIGRSDLLLCETAKITFMRKYERFSSNNSQYDFVEKRKGRAKSLPWV